MASDPAPGLGIVISAGDHNAAHAAFVLAAGAAALGRKVVIFATNAGCRALTDDLSGLAGAEREAMLAARGVAGIGALRVSVAELGGRMIACTAGLRAEGLEGAALAPGVEAGGVVTFLAAVEGFQLLGG
ncbi:MAG: DsrE/DsrF/DrsH-like family protein [Acetobacteraceae bacterium]